MGGVGGERGEAEGGGGGDEGRWMHLAFDVTKFLHSLSLSLSLSLPLSLSLSLSVQTF